MLKPHHCKTPVKDTSDALSMNSPSDHLAPDGSQSWSCIYHCFEKQILCSGSVSKMRFVRLLPNMEQSNIAKYCTCHEIHTEWHSKVSKYCAYYTKWHSKVTTDSAQASDTPTSPTFSLCLLFSFSVSSSSSSFFSVVFLLLCLSVAFSVPWSFLFSWFLQVRNSEVFQLNTTQTFWNSVATNQSIPRVFARKTCKTYVGCRTFVYKSTASSLSLDGWLMSIWNLRHWCLESMARYQAPPQGLSHPIHLLSAYPLRSKHPRVATTAIRFCHDDSRENDEQANSCMMAHLIISYHLIPSVADMLKYARTESRTSAHTARLTGTVIIIGEGWQTEPSPRRVHSGILPGMLLPVARCHGRILSQSHYNIHHD